MQIDFIISDIKMPDYGWLGDVSKRLKRLDDNYPMYISQQLMVNMIILCKLMRLEYIGIYKNLLRYK